MSILACVLAAVAAICIYACVAHVFAARHPWFRGVHLTFAALAVMAAVHAASHIAVYSATDVAAYVAAERYSNLAGALAMALIPWLVHGYFAAGRRWVAAVMSAFYALSGVLYELAAIGTSSRPMPLLERIELPWGETATIHRLRQRESWRSGTKGVRRRPGSQQIMETFAHRIGAELEGPQRIESCAS
jgi:hypothetical protein